MRISKLYFIILLLLLCLLALCACSTDVPPQGSAPTETTHTFAPNDQSILGAQIKVSYRVSDPESATLTGKTEQTIRWGWARARSALGYCWPTTPTNRCCAITSPWSLPVRSAASTLCPSPPRSPSI